MAGQGSVELENLLEAREVLRRPWKARQLSAVAAASLALALTAGVALWASGPRAWWVAEPEQVEGPPPPPEEKFHVPPHGHLPKIKPPAEEQMMGQGEEGCSGDQEDCVQGDELLDPDQRAARRLWERNATFGPHARSLYDPYDGKIKMWPHGIVKYSWDTGIDADAKSALEEGMKEWEAKTCIKFEEHPVGKGVVLFRSSHKGCNAHVGTSDHWQHHLNLEPPGCTGVGTAMHELGHTIGLSHQHERPAALKYIKFNLDNADEWWRQWLETDHDAGDMSAGIPYDMASIMHYGAWAGSVAHGDESKRTIVVKADDVFGNCQVGQRDYLSEADILTVNRWYGCPKHFCADLHQHCKSWKSQGNCHNKFKFWMKENCPHSCGECECKDHHKDCLKHAHAGYCWHGHKGTKENKKWMSTHCRKSCGHCLLEDVHICKDETIWDDPDGCSKHKDGQHQGRPWCKNGWFAHKCRKSCDLCPHRPFCW